MVSVSLSRGSLSQKVGVSVKYNKRRKRYARDKDGSSLDLTLLQQTQVNSAQLLYRV